MKPALLLVCLFPALLGAQTEYPVSSITPELLKNANVVVRKDEMVFRILPDGDAVLETIYVATIMNEEGKDAAIMVEYEDKFNKLKMLKGKVFDAAGELIRSTKDEDIQVYGGNAEYEFTDNQSKYLKLEYPKFPYTVEFRKKTQLKGFTSIPSSVIRALGVAVEHWHYRLEAPTGYAFKWKSQGLDLKVQESQKGDYHIWEWDAGQLLALPDEPYNPYFNDVHSKLEFAAEDIRYDGAKGQFKDWKSTGDFFFALNNGRETLSPQTLAQVESLTAGKTTREKIDILYRITQDQCRYVSIQLGIGGWQTFEAGFVEKKKYGDCKALSNYTQALLKAAGIEAWEASIYGSENGAPPCDENFPYPRFNHMILYVPSEDIWLECTSKTHPAGYLGVFTADRCALLFTPEGGKLVKTPALKAKDNFEKAETSIRLKEDGTAQIHCSAMYGGSRHDYYRHYALEATKEEWEKSFTQNTRFTIGKLEKAEVQANRNKPDAQVEYQLESPKYATLSGKRMFIPLTKTNPFKRSLPADEERVLPLHMTDSYLMSDTFVLHFPTGYVPENIPAGKKIDHEFGYYELQTETIEASVRVIRQVEVKPVDVPAARYGEVRQFFLDIAKADAMQMVLVKKE
ncbi:MAG: DUF3857 domain-containing protein [Saprospiraceae bacterium]|nr:DUF3857 domain-containing protein [Saprospiraceae bacterium]